MRKGFSLLIKVAGVLLALAAPASAQDYPTKPVKLIVPFPPGGSNDVVGRMIALQLGDRLGRQVIVDNRGGAGGIIGTEAASKAAPDGYTLLIISIAHAVSPWLYKLQYDPIKSFVPVSILASGPNVLVVHPSLGVHSVTELIALAKEKPGQLNYASAGIGSFQHLGGELFKLTAGINMVHVPYKGGGPAMTDVLGGYTKIMFSSMVQTTPFVLNGQLRALGTSGAKRNPALPDVPTIAEAGLPGYEATIWLGIMAPAGTPAPILDTLNGEINKVLQRPETRAAWAKQGAWPLVMSQAEFDSYLRGDIEKWAKVIRTAGIRVQQ